jgi:hypothetical protein
LLYVYILQYNLVHLSGTDFLSFGSDPIPIGTTGPGLPLNYPFKLGPLVSI